MDVFTDDLFTADSVEWREYAICKTLPDEIISNTTAEGNTGNIFKQFGGHLLNVAGFKLADVQRFVYAAPSEYGDINDSMSKSCKIMKFGRLLDLSLAQQFLSYLSCSVNCGNKDIFKILPLVILCDGHINTKNIYMFYVQSHLLENSALLLSKPKNTACSSLMVQTIACTGPLSSRFWARKDDTKPEVDDSCNIFSCEVFASKLAVQPHMIDIYDDFAQDSSISTSCFSLYHLFGESSSLIQSLNEEGEISSITVEVNCKQASHILGINPCHISAVTANVSPVPGDVRSPAYALYKDVLILEGLLNAFGSENHVKWAEREDMECDQEQGKTGKSLKSVFEKLADIMESFSKHSMEQNEKFETSTTEEAVDEEMINLIVPREELDFTEQIWNVLKFVENYQELVDALSTVMVEISAGRSTSFWLHEDSNTSLGKLIKMSYQGQTSTPALTGLLPVQILAEIGLEKLRRDYVSFFFTHHLSTSARLDQLCVISSEENVATKLTKRFNEIEKLHHVVELAAHCHSFLQLPLRKIDKIVRSALQDYTNEDVNFRKVFTFPLSYNEVKVYLDNSLPTLWKMNATARNENSKCTGSACWTVDFPFRGMTSPPEDTFSESLSFEDENNSLEYFLTTVTESVYASV